MSSFNGPSEWFTTQHRAQANWQSAMLKPVSKTQLWLLSWRLFISSSRARHTTVDIKEYLTKNIKYWPVAGGFCRCQFSLQWVVFCWCTKKGRQIPPSWAQKQGTPGEEWTHLGVESSLHPRCDCQICFKGFPHAEYARFFGCLGLFQFISSLHSLNSKTNYLVAGWQQHRAVCLRLEK